MTSEQSTKDPLEHLGTSLRQRYDDAFVRNEVVTLREQVQVLHDTLIAFITRVDHTLAIHEQRQLAQEVKLKKLFRGKRFPDGISSANLVSSGSKTDGESSPEGMAFTVMDAEGNPTNLIATISAPSTSYTSTELEEDDQEMDEIIQDHDEELGQQETEGELVESESPATRHTSLSKNLGYDALTQLKPFEVIPARNIDWGMLEAEAKTMMNLPVRKGKGGKVSGRLAAGSPAWTYYLRTAIRRSIGAEGMMKYARGGSLMFKAEQDENYKEMKNRVVDFCQRWEIVPPDERLMDEIAWAYLRNQKRYRAKPS